MNMLTRKDAAATGLTALVVLTFVATHESWNVPLVGSSHRWAAAAIVLLGIATCGLGSPSRDAAAKASTVLGILALPLAVLALAVGSLTVLALLVADTVLLWALATARHAGIREPPKRPLRGPTA
jgi:hypothetical protein